MKKKHSKCDFHCADLLEADFGRLYASGVRFLFLDLDNTLEDPRSKHPGERTEAVAEKAKSGGFRLGLISNSFSRIRVEEFGKALGAETIIARAGKPSARKIRKAIATLGLKIDEICLAGDQILTDRKAARRAGVRFLLLEPVVNYDKVVTRLNRLIDQKIRKRWKEKGLLGEAI